MHLRHRLPGAPRCSVITEIVSSHASTDDEDPFISKTFQCLAHAVMEIFILVIKKRDLDDRDVQGVVLGIEGYLYYTVSGTERPMK